MSFLNAFKSSMLEIIEETKKRNIDFADELSDRLFIWLDQEFESRINFKSMHSAINDINTHLQVVSSQHKAEADSYYKAINDEDLREPLAGFLAQYFRALSVENFPLACKCLFQQIETLVSYLMHKRGLIEKMSRDVKFMDKHKTHIKPNKSGGFFVPLFIKLILIGNDYRKELGKALISTEYNYLSEFTYSTRESYEACYNLRNSDSHGKSFYADGEEGISLKDFQDNSNFYLSSPLQLIKLLLFVCIELSH